MDPDTLVPTSALATSLIPALVSGGSGGSGDALARPSPASQNPARLLASLMDFPGSVALADLLAEPLARAPQGAKARLAASTAAGAAAPADRAALGERLQLDAEARLDSLEPMVLKP